MYVHVAVISVTNVEVGDSITLDSQEVSVKLPLTHC